MRHPRGGAGELSCSTRTATHRVAVADVVPRRWWRTRSRASTCNVSSVIQDKPNIGTDQIGSLAANYTLTAGGSGGGGGADRPSADGGRRVTVNLLPPGELYGDRDPAVGLLGEEDLPLRRPASDGGRGHLQPDEQQRDAGVQPDVRAEHAGLAVADVVHEPARVPSERRVRLWSRWMSSGCAAGDGFEPRWRARSL